MGAADVQQTDSLTCSHHRFSIENIFLFHKIVDEII